MTLDFSLNGKTYRSRFPEGTDILKMPDPGERLPFGEMFARAMDNPIDSERLSVLVRRSFEASYKSRENYRIVLVVSDATRPVPYRGDEGILWPLIEILFAEGFAACNLLILVATGTHRAMSENELRAMLDPRIFEFAIPVVNHDCRERENLTALGRTARGTDVLINRHYAESDFKILTGLVESHFMAGASGGRKSVCPGLVGEESTFVFHGAPMLSNPRARDLILEKNPCHEEALEVALKAGVDFIFNVTLDSAFRVTGVYAGDLQAAHREAVAGLKAHVAIETDRKYDIVVTHAGFVGLNHYQAAKAAAAALPLLHPRSRLIMAADCHDRDPVGKETYRRVLPFLKERSAEDFETLLLSREWTFVPDQWQVQMWARLFKRIPQEQFTFFAPQLTEDDYGILPGVSDRETLLPNEDRSDLGLRLERSLNRVQEECRRSGMEEPSIAWLADGPYGIPYPKDGA